MLAALIVMAVGFGIAFLEYNSGFVTNFVDINPLIVYVVGGIVGLVGLLRLATVLKWFTKGY